MFQLRSDQAYGICLFCFVCPGIDLDGGRVPCLPHYIKTIIFQPAFNTSANMGHIPGVLFCGILDNKVILLGLFISVLFGKKITISTFKELCFASLKVREFEVWRSYIWEAHFFPPLTQSLISALTGVYSMLADAIQCHSDSLHQLFLLEPLRALTAGSCGPSTNPVIVYFLNTSLTFWHYLMLQDHPGFSLPPQ